MWLWQRKNIQKRHLLWLKLCGICFFVHIILLSWVFFLAHDLDYALTIELHKHIDYSSPILFVPFGVTPSVRELAPAQSVIPTPMASVQQPLPKKAAPTTTLSTPKITQPEQQPTLVPEKPQQQKQQEKEKKRETPPEKIKPIIQKEKQQPALQELLAAHKVDNPSTQSPATAPENAHISHDYRHVEAMRRTALLQKELTKNWRPPVGSPPNASCDIACTVSLHGKVTEVTMIKSSGSIMYDLSARHALFAMHMPQWTQGKTITINFKQ